MEKIVIENKESEEKNYMAYMNNSDFMKKNKVFLEKNFVEALKDPDFVRLANELDTTDDEKYRHTSLLKEIVEVKIICSKCKGLAFCPYDIPGVRRNCYVEDGLIKSNYEKCPYKLKMDKESAYLKNVYSYKMPKDILNAKFKDIYTDDAKRLEAVKYLKEFYDVYKKKGEGKGLYLYGNFGCGKTYFISALFNELAKLGIHSTIVYFPEFLRSLKASFGNYDDNYDEKFDAVKESPLLLLDDIGAERLTDWARDEVLGVILQYRMEEHLPTFFTSNLSLKELEDHLQIYNNAANVVKARRIIERIKYLTKEIKMISVNRRV